MIKGNHKPGPLQKAQTSRTPAQNVDSISYGVGMRRSSGAYRGGRSARGSGNAASNQGASTQGVATAGPVDGVSAPPAKPSTQSARAQDAMPPVQTLE